MAKNLNHPNKPNKPMEPEKEHLGYLLTAYLFENISAAGRREVESHLLTCAACRDELESLRQTLGVAARALDDGGKEYVFEERRRQRVLQAAKFAHKTPVKQSGADSVRRPFWNFWTKGALAGMLMVATVCTMIMSSIRSRPERYAYKNAPPASAMPPPPPMIYGGVKSDSSVTFKSEGLSGLDASNSALAQAEEKFRKNAPNDGPVATAKPGANYYIPSPAAPAPAGAAAPESRSDLNYSDTASSNAPAAKKSGTWAAPVKESPPLVTLPEPSVPGARPSGDSKSLPFQFADSFGPQDKPAALATPVPGLQDRKKSDEKVAGDRGLFPIGGGPGEAGAVGSAKWKSTELSAAKSPAQNAQKAAEGLNDTFLQSFDGDLDASTSKGSGRERAKSAGANGIDSLEDSISVGGGGNFGNTRNAQNDGVSEGYATFGNNGSVKNSKNKEVAQSQPQQSAVPNSGAVLLGENAFGINNANQGVAPAPDIAANKVLSPDYDRQIVLSTDTRKFDGAKDREKNVELLARVQKTELSDNDGRVAKDGKTAQLESEARRYAEEVTKLKGVVIKQQQAVQVERESAARSGKDKSELENELNETKKDLALQTARINRLLEHNVPVMQILNEDPSAAQPPVSSGPGSKADTIENQNKQIERAKELLGASETDKEEDVGGRKEVAIAAKDDVIRSQNEVLAKQNDLIDGEKREKEEAAKQAADSAQLNEQLATQNRGLADRDARMSSENAARDRKELQGLDPNVLRGDFGDIRPLADRDELEKIPADARALHGKPGDVVVPPEILAKAELGDHFETVNPEAQTATKMPARKTRQAAVPDTNALEKMLRGYRYFHAENARLSFQDFLKRPAPIPPAVLTDEGMDEDAYIERYGTRPFVDCARDHLSTFGLDVDTASYTLARSRLRQGQLPETETVRVEEFLNYFKQPYEVAGDDAFGVFAEGAPSPFDTPYCSPYEAAQRAALPAAPQLEILKIGIKSRDPRPDERKPAMLTFVVDTSGSMSGANAQGSTDGDRLEMACKALKILVAQLNPEDAVCIVGFSDQAELILPRTQARQKQRIVEAIDSLAPHGATNVESGIKLGYRLADESYSPDAVNRVILCSDGVANVGAKGPDEILKLVKIFAGRGIELSTVGFGFGQYDDKMMARLADNGNGTCHFVDTLAEAQKIFTEQLPAHLNVLARDAKAQVDFNPDVVERYRLLGYEKRKIADKDFRNDKIDAGEIAHSTLLTVVYEIKRKPTAHGPLGKVYLRWKDAGYKHLPVVERNYPLSEGLLAGDARRASPQLRFTACVARFAELLRESPWARNGSYAEVLSQLRQLPADFQAREDWKELLELVTRAQALSVSRWSREL